MLLGEGLTDKKRKEQTKMIYDNRKLWTEEYDRQALVDMHPHDNIVHNLAIKFWRLLPDDWAIKVTRRTKKGIDSLVIKSPNKKWSFFDLVTPIDNLGKIGRSKFMLHSDTLSYRIKEKGSPYPAYLTDKLIKKWVDFMLKKENEN